MSDIPLRDIEKSSARQPLNKPSWADGKPVHGFDTETSDGDIFAIGKFLSDGEYRSIYDPDGIDGLDVLEFITEKSSRGSLNVWFNLNFDASVILKALPERHLQEVKDHLSTEWTDENGKEWKVTYIPRKMLEIRSDKNAYSHFDAQQFTYSDLEGAAEDWLGMDSAKLNDGLDVTRFGSRDYITENEGEIRRYLRRDCKLTRDIFRRIVEMAEGLDIPFGKPYSTGYVAADYVRNRLDYKPGWASFWVQEPAWETYRGGRFEVAKRGAVGKVYGADINSAYPAVFAELPDPSTLEWEQYGDSGPKRPLDEADIDTADYGFVKITATTDASRPFQPFAIANPDEGGRIEYPAIENVTKWVLLDEFRFCEREDFFEEVEVHAAVLGNETPDTVFPFDFFAGLYADRKTFGADGKKRHAELIKIVLNSLYGKTCQKTTKYTRVEDSEACKEIADDDGTLPFEKVQELPGNVDMDTDGTRWYSYEKAGRLFNPFLATYITGRTRLKLLESVVKNGIEDETVMLATDCIMCEAEAFENSGLYDEAEAEAESYEEALGGWDYDYIGDAFVIGSGVYEVQTEDGLKKGVRGFKDLYSEENDYDSIREAADIYPDGIPVRNERPLSIGDVLHRDDATIGDIGKFISTERKLKANMDTKRVWAKGNEIDFGDLLEGAEKSKPKTLSDLSV